MIEEKTENGLQNSANRAGHSQQNADRVLTLPCAIASLPLPAALRCTPTPPSPTLIIAVYRRLTVFLAAAGVALTCGAAPAWAEDAVTAPAEATPTAFGARWRVDAGLLAGLPAALGTGMTAGVGAGVLHAGTLTWGARASYSQATEYTTTWATTHYEVRLRAVGALQKQLGRGFIGLRLGAGATFLYEVRDRAQAARLGSAGVGLNTSASTVLPGGELEAFLALPIVGPIGLGLSAGPSLHLVPNSDGGGWTATPGWLAQLTAVWWP